MSPKDQFKCNHRLPVSVELCDIPIGAWFVFEHELLDENPPRICVKETDTEWCDLTRVGRTRMRSGSDRVPVLLLQNPVWIPLHIRSSNVA